MKVRILGLAILTAAGCAGCLAQLASVPFVGCESDGQAGPVPAPGRKSPLRAAISESDAKRLAYYQAGIGAGVLAPKGWHCFAAYGSSGSTLYVSPMPIQASDLFAQNWRLSGPVVRVSFSHGQTSGRFDVAAVIARVFPAHRKFVDEVLRDFELPAGYFAQGPYPADRITRISSDVVEFETPPNAEGMGLSMAVVRSSLPTRGVAFLDGAYPPSLSLVSVRLPADQQHLANAILRQARSDRRMVP